MTRPPRLGRQNYPRERATSLWAYAVNTSHPYWNLELFAEKIHLFPSVSLQKRVRKKCLQTWHSRVEKHGTWIWVWSQILVHISPPPFSRCVALDKSFLHLSRGINKCHWCRVGVRDKFASRCKAHCTVTGTS